LGISLGAGNAEKASEEVRRKIVVTTARYIKALQVKYNPGILFEYQTE
jgi:hypothetical protein